MAEPLELEEEELLAFWSRPCLSVYSPFPTPAILFVCSRVLPACAFFLFTIATAIPAGLLFSWCCGVLRESARGIAVSRYATRAANQAPAAH